jgi:protein ImuB
LAKHILCLYLPHWPITRQRRRHPEYLAVPVVVIRSIGQRRLVTDICPQSQSHGIRTGMSAAEAKALYPTLCCIAENPTADRRALDALGRWLICFTPTVSRGWNEIDEDTSTPPAVLFLDLTGSERLFGGMSRLIERVKAALQRFNIPAQMALAPTPGAAWAFALVGRHTFFDINFTTSPEAISRLPVESLRLDAEILDKLHQLGLKSVGDVLTLPREQLPSRFGPLLLKRLDQLTGDLIEPLTKLVTDPPITARMDFESPVESLEDIWRIFEKLLNEVLVDLTARNHGVRQLRMIFKPDRGWGLPTITRQISLSRPHRDRSTLLSLIRCESERVDCEHGFVRFQLDIPSHEPVAEAQTQLFEQQAVEEEMECDRLLQRLRVRLGEVAVIRPQLVESYVPERAWKPSRDEISTATISSPPHRPLTLFPVPIEIRVMCEPSDDRTGQPCQFTWQGHVHRLTAAVGPERIAGEWWRGHRHTRDYYDTEDEAGQRFWLFRVLHPTAQGALAARWFLHGRFD